MGKFIELHQYGGQATLVNADSVESVLRSKGKGVRITFINKISSVYYEDDYDFVKENFLKGESPKET